MPSRRRILGLMASACIPAVSGCAREVVRVATIGDSITYGYGVDRRRETYPAQLARRLGHGWEVRNFGYSAATVLGAGDVPYLETPAYRDALAFQPSVVVIMLGTNDAKPHNWKHSADFDRDLDALIASFRVLSSSPRIWLVLPPPAYAMAFAIEPAVLHDEVLPRIRAAAARNGVALIDAHGPLQDRAAWFPDAIHPTVEGLGVIAHEVAEALTRAGA